MKKIKTLLMAMVALLLPLAASAQVGVGSWILHSPFTGVTDVVDTPSKVYYLSEGTLYSYDKNYQETYCWNISNKLNSSGITGMYYNKDKKYLALTYSDSNIDLVYDNGRVVNMSDIKDAVMTEDKSINHVAFGNGRMYVGTAFGLVVFNDSKGEVIESAKYSSPVTMVAVVDGHLLIYINGGLKFIEEGKRIASLNNFSNFSDTFANRLGFMGIGDNKLLNILKGGSGANELLVSTLDFDTKTCYHKNIYAPDATKVTYVTKFLPWKKGVLGVSPKSIYYIDASDAALGETYYAPEILQIASSLQNNQFSSWSSKESVWVGGASGCEEYDMTDATPSRLTAAVTGSDLTTKDICKLYVGPSNRIYAVNTYINYVIGYAGSSTLTMNVIENGKIKPYPITGGSVTTNESIVEDPDNSSRVYIGTVQNAVFVVDNGEIIGKIDNTNSPLTPRWGSVIPAHVDIDGIGNLWILNDHTEDAPRYYMLPAAKRRAGNFSSLTAEDWYTFSVSAKYGDGFTFSLGCKRSNVMIIPNKPYWKQPLFVYNHNGTESVADDKQYFVTTFIDQDGKTLAHNHTACVKEDLLGRVWVGTDDGIFEITNPNSIDGSTITVNRLKVPRNDGTGLADYLLSSQTVLDIAVDHANRKWVTTATSGVYLVSPDGDEILEHYTMENSMLPSDRVFSAACDPSDDPLANRVFFGTEYGLVEYRSTSSPAQPDFSNVYAYPNPVRPDYTGWITITGLMDNSLVKITDAAGQIVHQDQSQGGMLTWNGCNLSGARVKTGVYYVLASVEGSSESVVTKILIVK